MIDFDDLDQDPIEETNERIRKIAHVANGGESVDTGRVCPKCNGSGVRVYGYVNHSSYPCGWCRQTGRVTKKREENIARAVKAEETRERNLADRRNAWKVENEELFIFLAKATEWSSFAQSLIETINEKGGLSERQMLAAQSMLDKAKAKEAERAAQRNATAEEVGVSKINELFDTAKANGLKRPVFRTTEVTIKIATRHENTLYVTATQSDEYLGKIVAGKWLPTRAAPETTVGALRAIAVDPLAAAVNYGRETGNCCCCGRELTDPASVDAGIGPICATKWEL